MRFAICKSQIKIRKQSMETFKKDLIALEDSITDLDCILTHKVYLRKKINNLLKRFENAKVFIISDYDNPENKSSCIKECAIVHTNQNYAMAEAMKKLNCHEVTISDIYEL